jgi:hypothetical protein
MFGEKDSAPGRSANGSAAQGRGGAPPLATLVRDLDQIRETLHGRLDELETRVRQRLSEPDRAERRLSARIAELEASEGRLLEELELLKRERLAMTERLEHDRRLLAEAWERLEREQAAAQRPALDRISSPGRPAEPAALRPANAAVAAVATREDPVAQEILRQFQTLRHDVRKNAHKGA